MRPTLDTARLTLREWRDADAEAALALDGDPEVIRFLGRAPVANLAGEQRLMADRLERNRLLEPRDLGSWAIVEQASGELIGNALLKPLTPTIDEIEVGWHLAWRAWGKGYASEAGLALLQYGFETLGLETILAVVAPANHRSAAVAQRIGMRWHERTTRYYDGSPSTSSRLPVRRVRWIGATDGNALRRRPVLLQGRRASRDRIGDDRDHDHQLDQREARTLVPSVHRADGCKMDAGIAQLEDARKIIGFWYEALSDQRAPDKICQRVANELTDAVTRGARPETSDRAGRRVWEG